MAANETDEMPDALPRASPQDAEWQHLSQVSSRTALSWGSGSAPSLPSVDDDKTETATLASSIRSSTMSVDSAVYHYIEENGRTYHRYKEGRYFLPNDLAEQERLDLQHELFVITINGRHHLAPIPENPGRVLDLATGTGIWAVEFAANHPESTVIGTDLSPIQPAYLPENCSFEIDDAEDEWSWSEPFDFIHGRALMSCFNDPGAVVKQAYNSTAPGGFIEFQDAIFPMNWIGEPPKESALYRWNEMMCEGVQKLGRSWSNVKNYPRYFEEAGFENITEKRFFWPVSPWAKGTYMKTVAMYFQEDMISGLEAMSLKVLGVLGLTPDQVKEFVEDVRNDFRDGNLHAYLTVMFIYAQKPQLSL
ncbi:S-adenosyl-L-methionine-dependent methyltransferase [Xylariaceae sp. FL0016]|nr:S-adenosyl-L-methionine-dependent methyltransferase [Xylariaceae sp. FL0016]